MFLRHLVFSWHTSVDVCRGWLLRPWDPVGLGTPGFLVSHTPVLGAQSSTEERTLEFCSTKPKNLSVFRIPRKGCKEWWKEGLPLLSSNYSDLGKQWRSLLTTDNPCFTFWNVQSLLLSHLPQTDLPAHPEGSVWEITSWSLTELLSSSFWCLNMEFLQLRAFHGHSKCSLACSPGESPGWQCHLASNKLLYPHHTVKHSKQAEWYPPLL